jgi:Fe-S-cluster containining protein
MEAIDKIRAIWEQIPSVRCKPGCYDCCGPVLMTKTEWKNITPKRKHLSLDCPYIKDSKCGIYNDRPTICRLFGTCGDHPMLKCPHGCIADNPITDKQAREILSEVQRIGN